jgi:hypothetical protein
VLLRHVNSHCLQKIRRYDPWRRNETIKLVRAYLVCLDELTVLGEIFEKKLDFFQRLRKDCSIIPELQDHIESNPLDNADGETPSERIAMAEHMMEDSSVRCKQLTADLQVSLNSVSSPSSQVKPCEGFQIVIPASSFNFVPSSKTNSQSWPIHNTRPSLSSQPLRSSFYLCRSSPLTLE